MSVLRIDRAAGSHRQQQNRRDERRTHPAEAGWVSEEVKTGMRRDRRAACCVDGLLLRPRCRLRSDLRGDVAVLAGYLRRRPWNSSETDGDPAWFWQPARGEEDWGRDQSTLKSKGWKVLSTWVIRIVLCMFKYPRIINPSYLGRGQIILPSDRAKNPN